MEAADQNNFLRSNQNSDLNKPIDMEEKEENKTQLTKEEISKFIAEKINPIETNTEVTISDPKLKDKIPASLLPNNGGEENEMK